MVRIESHQRTWTIKRLIRTVLGEPVLIPGGYYPDDLDTTSLALMVLPPHPDVITSVLDEMLRYLNSDGTIQVSHAKGLQFTRDPHN